MADAPESPKTVFQIFFFVIRGVFRIFLFLIKYLEKTTCRETLSADQGLLKPRSPYASPVRSSRYLNLICQYCGAPAVLASFGSQSYQYREDCGTLWLCEPCQAWIGAYSRSTRNVPLGRLANAELREWKAKLHAALELMAVTKAQRDAISIFEARAKGYWWLANALQIDEKAFTIHQLDADQCRAAVGVIEQSGRSRLDHAPSE